ncbi:DDE-type integrase/transposase/recombinase [Rhizobium sp. MJ21]|nr:DDE-type integrase/transposase/recombinase [Rhizobium sp. MJ21]MEB3047489.1 DDE-type integrase/transposase/recombinase [Rhizobium sp. MJ21]
MICIAGRKHWLWRAVDQDGYVLDEIVQPRRDTKAAKRLLIRLLRKQGPMPKRIVTDKLRSYGAAKREVMPDVEHRSHKGLNNRAENSPTAAKTRTDDAGISIGRRRAALRIDLFGSQKSLRRTTSKMLSSRHPHPSNPRHGTVEGRDRRTCLSSQIHSLFDH